VTISTWDESRAVATATHHWQADASDDILSNIDKDSLHTKPHTVHTSHQLQQKMIKYQYNRKKRILTMVMTTVRPVNQHRDYQIALSTNHITDYF